MHRRFAGISRYFATTSSVFDSRVIVPSGATIASFLFESAPRIVE
jgi:hypothetical protein